MQAQRNLLAAQSQKDKNGQAQVKLSTAKIVVTDYVMGLAIFPEYSPKPRAKFRFYGT
jgi:hypothetical protein